MPPWVLLYLTFSRSVTGAGGVLFREGLFSSYRFPAPEYSLDKKL